MIKKIKKRASLVQWQDGHLHPNLVQLKGKFSFELINQSINQPGAMLFSEGGHDFARISIPCRFQDFCTRPDLGYFVSPTKMF